MDQKMSADIAKLSAMMTQLTHQSPDDSSFSYQSPLTQRFLAEAEKGGRRWFSFGFDEWLRAGQWWLMSSQARLYSLSSEATEIEPQSYADLLKASSILLDILPRHPSIRLWDPTKEYLQFQLLANMLRGELETIETRGLLKPELVEVEQADLCIWTDTVKTVELQPASSGTGISAWEATAEENVFQGFGTFTYDRDVQPESCLILLLVSKKNIRQARIVAQNQRGAEVTSLRIDFDLLCGRPLPGDNMPPRDGKPRISVAYANPRILLGNGKNKIRLGQVNFSFSSHEELEEISCILQGIIFCQSVDGDRMDHAFLHGIILLFTLSYSRIDIVKRGLNSCLNRPCLQYAQDGDEFLEMVKSAASEFTKRVEPAAQWPSLLFGRKSFPFPDLSDDEAKLSQCIYFWVYELGTNLVSLGQPVDCLRQLRLKVISGKHYISDFQGIQSTIWLYLPDFRKINENMLAHVLANDSGQLIYE